MSNDRLRAERDQELREATMEAAEAAWMAAEAAWMAASAAWTAAAARAANAAAAHDILKRIVQEEIDARQELHAERERLLDVLDLCGGRNLEVANAIDEIGRQLGAS